MKPKPREAREHLLKALAALEDPQAYCLQNDHLKDDAKDPSRAFSCAVGAAKFWVEFALQTLGEPIDPYRPIGEPYATRCADQPGSPS